MGEEKDPTARAADSVQEDVPGEGRWGGGEALSWESVGFWGCGEGECPLLARGQAASTALGWLPSAVGHHPERRPAMPCVCGGCSPPWPARVGRRGSKTYKRAALQMPAVSFQAEKY